MNDWILLDDDHPRLTPLCDLRASFELRTGALTTIDRLTEQIGRPPSALIVPEPLAALVASRRPEPVNRLPPGQTFTFLNGRCTRPPPDPPDRPNTALLDADGSLIAAALDRKHAEPFLTSPGQTPDTIETTTTTHAPMIRRPWHALQHAGANLEYDLNALAARLKPLQNPSAPGVTVVGGHPVLVGRQVTVHPHVVFDTSAGPIALDDHAEVRSMSVLVGPGYAGPHTIITNHAHIRGRTIIGPTCKVGGEVNRSLFQGHANKAHGGYLGDSFIGEWVNLGAGTITSNLKNTYGQVRMQTRPDTPPEPTGTAHLGSILGDHTKTAIGTRLLTGTCVGTASMIALSHFPPKYIPPFTFLTDAGRQRYDLDRFHHTAQTMMTRRNLSITPELRKRLEQLHHTAPPV